MRLSSERWGRWGRVGRKKGKWGRSKIKFCGITAVFCSPSASAGNYGQTVDLARNWVRSQASKSHNDFSYVWWQLL